MKKLLIGAGILAFLATGAALAQLPPDTPDRRPPPLPPRTISVSGESHGEFAPDQAVLTMSLVSQDKDLNVAKRANDAMVDRLTTIARELSIAKEKIATSNISIAPQYQYDQSTQKQHFTGYSINRMLRVTTDAGDTPEKLLSAIVEAKIDHVDGIEFRLADPEAHAGPLRVKAFENAKAKAEALAQAAGSKLGPALDISTDGSMPMRPIPMGKRAFAVNAAAAPMSVAPSLPGLIDLQESVSVTFALE